MLRLQGDRGSGSTCLLDRHGNSTLAFVSCRILGQALQARQHACCVDCDFKHGFPNLGFDYAQTHFLSLSLNLLNVAPSSKCDFCLLTPCSPAAPESRYRQLLCNSFAVIPIAIQPRYCQSRLATGVSRATLLFLEDVEALRTLFKCLYGMQIR